VNPCGDTNPSLNRFAVLSTVCDRILSSRWPLGPALMSLMPNWVGLCAAGREARLPVSVLMVAEEAMVKGVAGVRGTEAQAGLGLLGHRNRRLKVDSAVETVEDEAMEASLKAGEGVASRMQSSVTVLSRTGASVKKCRMPLKPDREAGDGMAGEAIGDVGSW